MTRTTSRPDDTCYSQERDDGRKTRKIPLGCCQKGFCFHQGQQLFGCTAIYTSSQMVLPKGRGEEGWKKPMSQCELEVSV